LSGFDELSNLFDVEVISFDRADDFFNLFGFSLGEVFGGRKFLEDGQGGYGEGVFEGGLLVFGEDDREEREDLALVVLTFFYQFVAQFSDLPEGLDDFFGHLALDILPGSQELSDHEGVDVIGLGFFGQSFSKFVRVVRVEEDDGETIFFEARVEIFPESS
jgi:hypothetical protein